jgi:ribosomal protein S27AE
MKDTDCHGKSNQPTMREEECPDCGATVEMWSDEKEAKCECGRAFSFK